LPESIPRFSHHCNELTALESIALLTPLKRTDITLVTLGPPQVPFDFVLGNDTSEPFWTLRAFE